MKKLLSIVALSAVVLLGAFNVQAKTPKQKKHATSKNKTINAKDVAANINKIKTGNFFFYPNTVEPEFGLTHFVDGNAFLQVDENSIIAQLPFLGNIYATQRPFNIDPIEFVSDENTYSYNTEDGVVYDVTIIPEDLISVVNEGLVFNIKININNGNATMVINSDNLDPVTYTGYFE